MTTKNSLGLVLSGGGFRGIAHIGVIKLLEELEILPDYVAGTSAGALVGAFYAGGYTADEILDFFIHTKFFSLKNYAFRKAGLLDSNQFSPTLLEYFPDNRFDALARKLFIARTNLESGAGEIIQQGKLIPNVLASAALPLMFAPVEIDDVLYADGGITNNFPVEPLVPLCRKLIGVYVNPLEMEKKQAFKHAISVIERAFHISLAHSSIPKFAKCEVMIVPEKLSFYSILDTQHIQEIFEIGYQAALQHKDQFQNLLGPK